MHWNETVTERALLRRFDELEDENDALKVKVSKLNYLIEGVLRSTLTERIRFLFTGSLRIDRGEG
jgi:hypothetical protein